MKAILKLGAVLIGIGLLAYLFISSVVKISQFIILTFL